MPKSCRAPHCSNAAGQPRPPARRLSFYKFPLQDAARLRQWLAQMRQENWVPTRHQHLCSDHFEPSCFQYRWGVRYLRPDAVPTIFPPKRESANASPSPTRPTQPRPASGAKPVTPRPAPGPETTAPEAIAITLEPSLAVPPPLGPLPPVEHGDVTSHSQPSPSCVTATAPGTRVEDPALPPPCFEPATAPATVLSSALRLPIVSTVPIVSKTVTAMSPPGELSTEELVGAVLVLRRKVKVLQQRRRRHRARLEAMEGLVEQLRRESLLSEERLRACLQPVPPDPATAVTVICQEEEEEEEEEEEGLVYPVPPPTGDSLMR